MKRQRQKLFRVVLAGVLMIFSFMVYAQERIVTGKVYDSSGESIIGASVMVQGTMQGVKIILKLFWKKTPKSWTKWWW